MCNGYERRKVVFTRCRAVNSIVHPDLFDPFPLEAYWAAFLLVVCRSTTGLMPSDDVWDGQQAGQGWFIDINVTLVVDLLASVSRTDLWVYDSD